MKDKNQHDGIKFLFWIGFEVKEGEGKFYDGVGVQEWEEPEETTTEEEEETTTEEEEEKLTNEELKNLLEMQAGNLGWENWDDAYKYFPQFSNIEKKTASRRFLA